MSESGSAINVDLDAARRAANLSKGRVPDSTPQERAEMGEEIRQAVANIDPAVRHFNGWSSAPATPIPEVISRADWIDANLVAVDQLVGKLKLPGAKSSFGRRMVARATGVQIGVVLGIMSQKTLGQYDVLGGERLLFVGPNLLTIERQQGLDSTDLRRWIALHEVTHRHQFSGVPWLRAKFDSLLERSMTGFKPHAESGLKRLKEALESKGKASLPELVLSHEQRALLDEAQAMMTVVEGHATFVMNRLGVEMLKDLDVLKSGFENARGNSSSAEKVFMNVTGITKKRSQYTNGERFFNEIVDAAGLDAMRAVFDVEENLPSTQELKDSKTWLARVEP